MATKKAAAGGKTKKNSEKTAKKGSGGAAKKGSKANPTAAQKAATKARAPRGRSVTPDEVSAALRGSGDMALADLATVLGTSKHIVRSTLKAMGDRVVADGKTNKRTYRLAA